MHTLQPSMVSPVVSVSSAAIQCPSRHWDQPRGNGCAGHCARFEGSQYAAAPSCDVAVSPTPTPPLPPPTYPPSRAKTPLPTPKTAAIPATKIRGRADLTSYLVSHEGHLPRKVKVAVKDRRSHSKARSELLDQDKRHRESAFLDEGVELPLLPDDILHVKPSKAMRGACTKKEACALRRASLATTLTGGEVGSPVDW